MFMKFMENRAEKLPVGCPVSTSEDVLSVEVNEMPSATNRDEILAPLYVDPASLVEPSRVTLRWTGIPRSPANQPMAADCMTVRPLRRWLHSVPDVQWTCVTELQSDTVTRSVEVSIPRATTPSGTRAELAALRDDVVHLAMALPFPANPTRTPARRARQVLHVRPAEADAVLQSTSLRSVENGPLWAYLARMDEVAALRTTFTAQAAPPQLLARLDRRGQRRVEARPDALATYFDPRDEVESVTRGFLVSMSVELRRPLGRAARLSLGYALESMLGLGVTVDTNAWPFFCDGIVAGDLMAAQLPRPAARDEAAANLQPAALPERRLPDDIPRRERD